MARLYSNENFPLPVVERLRVLACVQEVAVTPGELLADADLIHYTRGASEKDEEEAIRKAVDRRLVRRTLRGALLGLEIGTSQGTLPIGAGRFGRAPHIVLSGAFLALRAPDCNGWPRDGLGDNGAIGTQEESAVFRRNTRALRVLRDSGPVERKGRSLPHHSPRYATLRASRLRDLQFTIRWRRQQCAA